MFINKQLFIDINGFDENYDPTCYEDTDISLKIRNYGKELYYSNCLNITHLPHQTTNIKSDNYNELIKNKGDYFVRKWKKINPKLLKYIK